MPVVIEPSVEIHFHFPVGCDDQAEFIERAGRICYKSEDRITEGSADRFVRMIMERGHYSVIEHCTASVRFVCDRGVTHELVRHRLASYSQESTRYCNYTKEKHNKAIGVIMPPFNPVFQEGQFKPSPKVEMIWRDAMVSAEAAYFALIEEGEPPQIARSVLPICLKTEIIMTCNLREWMHVFRLRCSPKAHPQIRTLMLQTLEVFADGIPEIFKPLRSEILGEEGAE